MRRRKVAVLTAVVVFLVLMGAALRLIKRGFSARDNPPTVEAFVARAVRRLAIRQAAKEARNPFAASPELLAEAKAHFADHCAICHANNGSGATTMGQNMYPKPPDMRLPQTQSLRDGEIYYIIHNGIRLTGMPAWGEAGPHQDEDSWKLVLFIRHLPKLTPEEEKEMQKFNPKSPAELLEEQEEEQFLNSPEGIRTGTHHQERQHEISFRGGNGTAYVLRPWPGPRQRRAHHGPGNEDLGELDYGGDGKEKDRAR